MDNLIETVIYKGHKIDIGYDECAFSPREDDNLGKILMRHKRYKLPFELPEYKDMPFDELMVKLAEDGYMCIMPIYGYEHGTLSFSVDKVYPFTDNFDSGLVGVICIKREDVLKEFNVKEIDNELLNKVINILKCELKDYESYFNGEIYAYSIIPEEECLEKSVSNYYDKEQCLIDAKISIDYFLKKDSINHTPDLPHIND